MAKKTKRSRSKPPAKKIPSPALEAESPAGAAPVENSTAATETPKSKSSPATGKQFEDEYSYIVGDLRRVLILAAVMFVLLITANLILSRINF